MPNRCLKHEPAHFKRASWIAVWTVIVSACGDDSARDLAPQNSEQSTSSNAAHPSIKGVSTGGELPDACTSEGCPAAPASSSTSPRDKVPPCPADTKPSAGGPKESRDELRELMAAAIDAYDRNVMSNCPCFVEQGAFATVKECYDWQKPGADWVSCGTEAMRPLDSPALRQNLLCLQERIRASIDCSGRTACEAPERADCDTTFLLCFAEMSDAILELNRKCPDFSLLPRQPPDEAADPE